jgi:hypothetical protein
LSDDVKEVTVQLVDDILCLQDALEFYVTNLRPNIEINSKSVNILNKYKSKTRLTSKSSDIPLIKAVLQRHVLETIFGYASVYSNIKNFNEPNSLEALIANKAEVLIFFVPHCMSILIRLTQETYQNRYFFSPLTSIV